MPQYRLKIELFDAVQFNGSQAQAEAITAAMLNVTARIVIVNDQQVWDGNLTINTGVTFEIVEPGDYIFTRADSTRFKVTAADFLTKYEAA